MKKVRTSCILLAVAMVFVMFMGCSSQEPASPGTSSDPDTSVEQDQITIGVTFDYVSDFMSYVNAGAEGYGKDHPEIKVIISDANKDVSAQLKAVENFIVQDVDAIVIKPQDKDACQPITDACKEAGIPLVCSNAAINSDYDVFVGSDNLEAGIAQGEWMAERLGGKGNIAHIMGDPTISNSRDRTEGNKQVFADYPDIKIVDEQIGKWLRDQGMSIAENWLQQPELQIDAIVSNNDEMAIGCMLAFKDAGIDIPIIGVGGTKAMLEYIKSGDIEATVYQDGYAQGYDAVDAAVRLVQGEKLDKFIPALQTIVTIDNVDEFLAKLE